jgi:hypothetical protein
MSEPSAFATAVAATPRDVPGASSARSAWRMSLPLACAAAVYAYTLAYGRGVLMDGDTLTHIASGHWMLEHGAVPTQDPFTHTFQGAPWIAHEWLAQLLLALTYDAGGFGAVMAFTGIAFALTIGLLTRSLLRWLEPIYVLLFVVFGAVMTAGHLLARPHMLALPLLVWWTCELVRARADGDSPRLVALPLMVLWANLHGGFTLGLLLAGAFAVEAVIDAPAAARHATARRWGRFVLLAALASLLTPHGVEGPLFTWHILVNLSYTLTRVGEWRSPDFHQPQPLELWLLGALGFAMMQGIRFPLVRVALVLLLAHLSLKHIRNVELLGLLAPVLLAPALAAHRRRTQVESAQLTTVDRVFNRLSAPAGRAAAAAAFFALALATVIVDHRRPLEPLGPAKAVAAARAAHLSGPVLNSYSWGGYLTFVGVPPFIDGRADIYGDAHVREYVEVTAPASLDAMQKLLDKHHIAWTLLDPTAAAIALLDLSPGWRRVYADETAVIHARVQPLAPTPKP